MSDGDDKFKRSQAVEMWIYGDSETAEPTYSDAYQLLLPLLARTEPLHCMFEFNGIGAIGNDCLDG